MYHLECQIIHELNLYMCWMYELICMPSTTPILEAPKALNGHNVSIIGKNSATENASNLY